MNPLPELSAFLEGLPEPHILFDAQYRIVAANAAYRREFGPGESVVGRTCYEVSHHFSVPCDQAGESCPLAQSRRSGQRERVLHLHHTPQGEVHVNIELVPLRNGDGQQQWFIEKMESLNTPDPSRPGQRLLGRSPAFLRLMGLVSRVAPAPATVLLLGESGTGKELLAQALHDGSPRAGRPLVVVDCASLPEALFESELFGHERGAFTGALQTRTGLVAAASGGTLFLDEVGDIPLSMQVKLLRLLESGTYRRVGSTEWRHADIRVVAATHRNLQQMVADGRFREDLYYRLSAFPIHVPPLRDRGDDVLLLAQALLKRLDPRPLHLSDAALDWLRQQRFPGNVRQLRNLLERAALLCDGRVIDVSTLAEPDPALKPAGEPGAAQAASERSLRGLADQALRARLAQGGADRSALARELGISERTLYRQLRRLRQTEAGSPAPASETDTPDNPPPGAQAS